MPIGSDWRIYGHDHPPASLRNEGLGSHFQVTAQEAAERGWYYRREHYLPLEPDTRKCRDCGRVLFEALTLTDNERKLRSPMSTAVLLHEDGF